MDKKDLTGIFKFLSKAYNANWTLRWSHTPYMSKALASGKTESILGHKWAMMELWYQLRRVCPNLNAAIDSKKFYEIVLNHDLGETFLGDISAIRQLNGEGLDKHIAEHQELEKMSTDLPKYSARDMLDSFDEFEKETGIDLNDDETAMQRVREAAEKAKIELSTTMETEINLPFISAGAKGPKHLQLKISRSKLEEIVDHIVQRCKKPVEQAMRDAKLSKNDIAKVIMVGGPTRMPIVRKFVKEILGKEPEGGVDPMECVAMGAAIQAGVLSGEVKDILLLDVTPLTLGIETLGGIRTPLIQRNTTIPTKKSQTFSTAADNQPAVTVHVLQGEREMASDNKSLGTFELTGIPPAPRGIPQIEVTFDIDANGILSVSAKDMGTGKEQTIKITASQKLKDEDIERMKKEAEKFAEDDKKRKENIETKNNSDSLIYSTEKILEEYKDKIDADTREKVSAEIKELKEAIAKDDFDKMKRKFDDLQKKAQEIGTKMYQQNKPEGHEDSEHKGKKKKDNTVDAEVVDEEK